MRINRDTYSLQSALDDRDVKMMSKTAVNLYNIYNMSMYRQNHTWINTLYRYNHENIIDNNSESFKIDETVGNCIKSTLILYTLYSIGFRIINREGDLREDFSAEIVSLDIAEKEKKDTRSIIAAIIICTDIVLIVELLCKTMMLENPSFSLFSIICLSICGMALGAQSWLQKLQYMNQIIELHNNVDTKMGE